MVHWADRVVSVRARTLRGCFFVCGGKKHDRWRDQQCGLHHQPEGREEHPRSTNANHRKLECSASLRECQLQLRQLERQLHPKLHLPRLLRAEDASEIRRAEDPVRHVEICAVEQIEDFPRRSPAPAR